MRNHLIRHGAPDCPPQPSLSSKEYRGWMDAYRAAGIIDNPPDSLRTWLKATGVQSVFSSVLPRSVQSARALVGSEYVRSSALFNEAAITIPPLSFRMKSSFWTTLGRIIWLCGGAAEEHVAECQVRARAIADVLMEAASESETVLMGHGWMNRMTGKELRKRGFERLTVTANGFWSRASFHKPSQAFGNA